jgi:pilus assembly protein TadC
MQFIGLLLLLIGAGIFVLVYGMWLKARRTERLARLYEQAMDKGLDPRSVRFELDDAEDGDPQGNFKAGIFLLAIALALVAGLWAIEHLPGPWRLSGFALVPAMAGLAALLIHFIAPRNPAAS